MKMILLNGRAKGDVPGNFTFSNWRGQSLIDLVFMKSETVDKCIGLIILDVEYSPHFPVAIKLDLNFSTDITKVTKLVWKNEKASQYKQLQRFFSPSLTVHMNIFVKQFTLQQN